MSSVLVLICAPRKFVAPLEKPAPTNKIDLPERAIHAIHACNSTDMDHPANNYLEVLSRITPTIVPRIHQQPIVYPQEIACGKDVLYILEKAVRVRGDIRYNYSFILLDTDREWTQTLKNKAAKKHIELIGNSPCLEGLFLCILDPKNNYSNHPSNECKKQFQNNYLHENRTVTDIDCKRLFTKVIIDSARAKIKTINRIIEIVRGDY